MDFHSLRVTADTEDGEKNQAYQRLVLQGVGAVGHQQARGCKESQESLRRYNGTPHKIVVPRCAGKTFFTALLPAMYCLS